LLPWRTILANVILAAEVRGVPKRESIARAQPLIERYGLGGFEQHYPHELSGGMRQRASLLRTMLYDRDVVLLDEPFGALDAQTRLLMQSWLLQIWSDFRKTILSVTHDIDEAVQLADRVVVLGARPAKVQTIVSIDIPHPRDYSVLTTRRFPSSPRCTCMTILTAEAICARKARIGNEMPVIETMVSIRPIASRGVLAWTVVKEPS